MDRKRKVAAGALVSVALLALVVPFLFKSPVTTVKPPTGGDGGTIPTTQPPNNPPSQTTTFKWSGWHGFCNGQGHHYGIVKKAAELHVTLTCA